MLVSYGSPATPAGPTLNNSRPAFIRTGEKFYVSGARSDAGTKPLQLLDTCAAILNRI
jgi:hypothetical protein